LKNLRALNFLPPQILEHQHSSIRIQVH